MELINVKTDLTWSQLTFPTVLLRTAVCGQCISLFDSRKDTTLETDYTGWKAREACACLCLSKRCVFLSVSLQEWQRRWRRRGRARLKLMWRPSRFTYWLLSVPSMFWCLVSWHGILSQHHALGATLMVSLPQNQKHLILIFSFSYIVHYTCELERHRSV